MSSRGSPLEDAPILSLQRFFQAEWSGAGQDPMWPLEQRAARRSAVPAAATSVCVCVCVCWQGRSQPPSASPASRASEDCWAPSVSVAAHHLAILAAQPIRGLSLLDLTMALPWKASGCVAFHPITLLPRWSVPWQHQRASSP